MIAGVLLALLFLFVSDARAQSTAVTTTFDRGTLADLPTTDSVSSILETAEPSIVSDRFSAGGLNTGSAARLSSFFSSPSETMYRIGDVDFSDPTGSGEPLLIPGVDLWQHFDVQIGQMPIDIGAPGLALTFVPERPAASWRRRASISQFGSTVPRSGGVPPIVQLDSWRRIDGSASGPILVDGGGVTRLSGMFAASSTIGRQFDRAATTSVEGSTSSGFAELLFKTGANSELQAIGWVERFKSPFDQHVVFGGDSSSAVSDAAHVQGTWNMGRASGRHWRVYAGYTKRDRTPEYDPSNAAALDSLLDGPVTSLAYLARSGVSRWSAGIRTLPPDGVAARHQRLEAGVEIGGSRAQSSSFFTGLAGELVDGIPARLWSFTAPGGASVRHETTAAAHLEEQLAVAPRLVLHAGFRIQAVSGQADGSSSEISWRSVLPRASLEWTIASGWQTKAFVGVGRSASALPLDVLAIGDPAAPVADVFQWTAAALPSQLPALPAGAPIARVGPGTGGDAQFSTIAPGLKVPTTDEFAVGIESHMGRAVTLRAVGFARRTRHLLALVDVGAPLSAYSTTRIPDPSVDLVGAADDQLLPVYNRLPSSFGQDRYVLQNSTAQDALSKSFEISGALNTAHLTISGGATASMAEGSAANRGYGPLDNDQSLIGELFTDPNAETFSRGRLFSDRAYTIKASVIGRLPADVHIGVLARYQDGQPFARLVVVTGLNQGSEAVRAFPNGDSRFTFTETIDARLQKGFGREGRRVFVVFDLFNALNTKNEVEEQTVTGPGYRSVTAIQPPRTLHVGLRVEF